MGYRTLFFALSFILFAYYIYIPMPEGIDDRWKLAVIDAAIKIASNLAEFTEAMGLMKYEEFLRSIMNLQLTNPISDENLTVIDVDFRDIPVRLYLPKRTSERQRPAVIYFHGGGFVIGSCKMSSYDFLNRWTAMKLDAVVVGVDHRLAPKYPFPIAFEDSISVVKFFLQSTVLAKYKVDPARICVSGDSSGGTLAAAVSLMLQSDPEIKNKLKAQALISPGLQLIDSFMPSHQLYQHGPLLTRAVAAKLISRFVSEGKMLYQAIMKNQHMPEESRPLFKFVNWSTFLPEKYKKNHIYTEPILGKLNVSNPNFMDSRVSPLLATDAQLQKLQLTYLLTCEHDILRDDGLIYVARLRKVGVQVTHDHLENGYHGALSFATAPFNLNLALKIRDKYTSWLKNNL
uniref:arylacetamide deacetylase-like 2 n=1 Tax=Jaculus jaculus TaxID=51337 RepID=UPI001E1AFF2F|nr:arylacetamide deacetylase-like 2 [Jaculus jaculus]